MTAQQLADRCALIGAPHLTASVIANIETGRRDDSGRRRRDVTVDEWLDLAYALNASPSLLLLPLDRDQVAITPTLDMHPADALAWISGESEPSDGERRAEWREVMAPVSLYRAIRQYWEDVARIEATDTESKHYRFALRMLAQTVDAMIDQGLVPVELPAEWVSEMKREDWLRHPAEVPIQKEDCDDGR